MSNTKGCIFDIQRFSLHDGPGIRTTVFLKGCNLRCIWCHNPESINPKPEIQEYMHKCIGCLKCFTVCPQGAIKCDGNKQIYTKNLCIACGSCTEVCYAGARVMTGKYMDSDEVVAEVERDKLFYGTSGGGVTFSGGEPMLQKEFLLEALTKCKDKGIHTAVDTAGNVPYSTFKMISPYTDLFLYDLKVMDDETHKKVTGVGNKLILENLKKLSDDFENIYIRIPVIPGINDTEENMTRAGEYIKSLRNIKQVELLSFHKMAEGKYTGLGMEFKAKDIPDLDKEHVKRLGDIFTSMGIKTQVS